MTLGQLAGKSKSIIHLDKCFEAHSRVVDETMVRCEMMKSTSKTKSHSVRIVFAEQDLLYLGCALSVQSTKLSQKSSYTLFAFVGIF